LAARFGHAKCTELLLNAGADKEETLINGSTALIIAVNNGHAKCTELLLNAGADKEATLIIDGSTALIIAAKNGYAECTELLLNAGADKEAKEIDGCTALIIAAGLGHDKCIELLLNAGSDKETTPHEKYTALIIAAHMDFAKCVELLLNDGANKDAKNNRGSTALMLARKKGHAKCVELLLNADNVASAERGISHQQLLELLQLRPRHLSAVPIAFDNKRATEGRRQSEKYALRHYLNYDDDLSACDVFIDPGRGQVVASRAFVRGRREVLLVSAGDAPLQKLAKNTRRMLGNVPRVGIGRAANTATAALRVSMLKLLVSSLLGGRGSTSPTPTVRWTRSRKRTGATSYRWDRLLKPTVCAATARCCSSTSLTPATGSCARGLFAATTAALTKAAASAVSIRGTFVKSATSTALSTSCTTRRRL
jgi:hypothetical protein